MVDDEHPRLAPEVCGQPQVGEVVLQVLARKHGVEMPITEGVAAVIAGAVSVGDAAAVLTSRSAKPEWYGA